MRVQLLNVTIKGDHSVFVLMSVQHGRQQRQLYTPARAMYQFKQTEGRAMAPTVVVSLGRAMLALIFIVASSTVTTIGVYNSDTRTMYIGILLLFMVAYWMMVHMS